MNLRSRAVLVLALAAIVVSLAGVLQLQLRPVGAGTELERPWSWPVAYPRDSSTEVGDSAKRLAAVIGVPGMVWATDVSLGCCLWLEIGEFRPNPSEPGYLVILQGGGGRLIASDVQQLDLAIERLTKVRTVLGNGRVALPMGVLTNWPVID